MSQRVNFLAALFVVAISLSPLAASSQSTCPSLSLGSTGAQVTAVQEILYAAYNNFPTPTGYFGPLTQAAVKQWQKEHGIEQTGTVGPKTAAAMKLCTSPSTTTVASTVSKPITTAVSNTTRTLSKGMSGADVTALQQFLITQKLLTADSATGYFGALTEAAVKKFQSQKGIASSGTSATTGYGAVGPRTRAALSANGASNASRPSNTVLLGASQSVAPSSAPQTFRTGLPPAPTQGAKTPPTSLGTQFKVISSSSGGGGGGGGGSAGGSGVARTLASCSLKDVRLESGQAANFYSAASVQSPATCVSVMQSRTCTNGKLSGDVAYEFDTCSQTQPPAANACTLDGATLENGAEQSFYSSRTTPFGALCSTIMQRRTCTDGKLSGVSTYQYASCSPALPRVCVEDGATVAHGQSATFYTAASVQSPATCVSVMQSRTCADGTLSGSAANHFASCEQTNPPLIPRAACSLDGESIADGSSQTFYSSRTVPYGTKCTSLVQSRTCTNGTLSGAASYQYARCVESEAVSCPLDGKTLLHGQTDSFYSASSVLFGSTCTLQSRTCANGTLSGAASYKYANCTVGQPASCTLDGTTVQHSATQTFYSSRTVPYGTQCASVTQPRTCTNATLSGANTYQYATCVTDTPASCTINGQTFGHGTTITAYQSAHVPHGQSCVQETRMCINGTLSGSYTSAACTINEAPPVISIPTTTPAPATDASDADGYYLVDAQHIFGNGNNCNPTGPYYGVWPDLPCNNQNQFYARNTWVTPYRAKVQAEKDDLFRVLGQVSTTNDGNLGYIVETEAIACANARDVPVERDPITGNIDPAWSNKQLAICPYSPVAPDGTALLPDASTAVAQLIVKDASGTHLLGGRAQQEHGYDNTNNRKCASFLGQNCRGHMSEAVSGLYTAPADGQVTFEMQVADMTLADLKRFSVEAALGQIIVEQYRRNSPATTAGFSLAEVSQTRSQQISQYGQASCPGHDDQTIHRHPDAFSVFKLSTNAGVGDIVRIFSRAIGMSITPDDTDAMALGIWRSPIVNPTPTNTLDFVSRAWALYGNSTYLPIAMMYAEGFDKITSAGTKLYRTSLHSSDTPVVSQDCDNPNVIIAPADMYTAYGGNVVSNSGEMSLMRFSPRTGGDGMLLRSAKEYKTPLVASIATDGAWKTVFQDSFMLDDAGAARIWSQFNMQNTNLSDQGTTLRCYSRITIDAGPPSGETVNAAYSAIDNIYLVTHLVKEVSAGSHTFKSEVRCTAADGRARTFNFLSNGVYGSLETFSKSKPALSMLLTIDGSDASPVSVSQGSAATIEWTAQNAHSCSVTADGGFADGVTNKTGFSGSAQTPVYQTAGGSYSYTLSCWPSASAAAPISKTIAVSVSEKSMSFTINGSEGPTVSAVHGTAATLAWSSKGMHSCSVTADGGFADGVTNKTGFSGSAQTPVYQTAGGSYSYTLSCWPSASAAAPISKTIAVSVAGKTMSLTINGSAGPTVSVPQGAAATIAWDSQNMYACSVTADGGFADGVTNKTGFSGSAQTPAYPFVGGSYSYTLACWPSASAAAPTLKTIAVSVAAPVPVLSITANGTSGNITVPTNTAVTIAWSATNVQQNTCSVAGPTSGDLFEGSAGLSGSKQTPSLTQTSYYFLSCVRADTGQPISTYVRVDVSAAASATNAFSNLANALTALEEILKGLATWVGSDGVVHW